MALVEVSDFSFAYPADGDVRRGDSGDCVLDGVSFEVNEGDFCVLLGSTGSGKTTLLRQIARELAAQKRAVAVIDERGELFPPERQNGDALDCISGLPKGRAVQMALRTLAPQVILLDELGDLTEVAALEQGFFSGVEFVASVHAATLEDALQRPQVRVLQQQGALRFLVLLEGRCAPGRIREIRQLPLL